MKQLLFTLVAFLFSCVLFAQKPSGTVPPDAPYSFYLSLSNVQSKQQVLDIQERLGKQAGVVYCMANTFPVEYFLIKSKQVIQKSDIVRWLNNTTYRVQFFGEGERAREKFYLQSRSNNGRQ
jgi:hypothetical protein